MDTDGNGFFAGWNDWRKDLNRQFKRVMRSSILSREGDILLITRLLQVTAADTTEQDTAGRTTGVR